MPLQDDPAGTVYHEPTFVDSDAALQTKVIAAMSAVPDIYRCATGTSTGYIDCYFEVADAGGNQHPVRFRVPGFHAAERSLEELSRAIGDIARQVRANND